MAHEAAHAIARTINPASFSWIKDKEKLLSIVDSITLDITDGQDIDPNDLFLIGTLGQYVGTQLVLMDRQYGWDVKYQTQAMEEALLRFLGERWVFYKITGRLR